jgi:hypothetical protein
MYIRIVLKKMKCECFVVSVIILIIIVHICSLCESHYKTDKHIHVYGVGIFKSGTESLACMFENYRSEHEYENKNLFELIVQNNDTNIINYIINKNRKYSLELDSSGFNIFIVPHLLHLYPDCKFILTTRNIIDHYDSIINHLNLNPSSVEIATYIMGNPNINIPEEEHRVAKRYSAYWSLETIIKAICRLNDQMITLIPKDRLLILDIFNDDAIHKISSFLNINPTTLKTCHRNKAIPYIKASSMLDTNYVDKIITRVRGNIIT